VPERRRDCGKAAGISQTITDASWAQRVDDGAMPLPEGSSPPRVVVAGGGVAGLETCLALRSRLSPDDLAITLVAPSARFDYRPLAVLEPFEGVSRWSMALASFAADQGVEFVQDALVAVAPHGRTAATGTGHDLPYDALVVAIGGRSVDAIPGALTFRGPREGYTLRALLRDAPTSIAFATPPGATWPLPLYELALMSASALRRAGAATKVTFITNEESPLAVFGGDASELVAGLLAARGIDVVASVDAVALRGTRLTLDDGRSISAEHVVALPRIVGRRIDGLARDAEDFVPIDDHCRVVGLDHVYAAGDVANFPVKHGGLAAQQADAVAEAIAAELGLPVTAQPFDPVIEGILLTGDEASYVGAGGRSLWWPPSKIAGRHLAPHLITRAGLPAIAEIASGDAHLQVAIDAHDIVRGVRPVVGADSVPLG
jgi:sulfide:quinone oxidoreductase